MSVRKAATLDPLARLRESASQAAALLKSLGNERRLLLLCSLIEHGELTAGELADAVELSPSACSQHLAKMREEGVLASRREGSSVHYRIDDPGVKRLIATLKSIYCP